MNSDGCRRDLALFRRSPILIVKGQRVGIVKQIELTIPSERVIGFTIPRDGVFHVCDHDEVWSVRIGPPASVEVTDYAPYEFANDNADFVGWGQRNGRELKKAGSTEISYDFDPLQDFQTVECKIAGRVERRKFRTFSGDWFSASLSTDGRFLVLAEPYRIELYDLA